jgi:hypothetical protein
VAAVPQVHQAFLAMLPTAQLAVTKVDLAGVMRVQRLLAESVDPGDRVLYVGDARRFFGASRNHLATSRSADSIFDPSLDGDFFDVIITRGAIDLLSDNDAFVWARQALTRLGPNGRLVVALRPIWLDMSWPDLDFSVLRSGLDEQRIADPRSVFACVARAGFRNQGERQGWFTHYVVNVFTPTSAWHSWESSSSGATSSVRCPA